VEINFSNIVLQKQSKSVGNSMVTLLQRVYIMLYQTDFTKALFDFKMTCNITVHVNSTDTEEKVMKLKLGYNFFLIISKTTSVQIWQMF
jgi:hypothetical protein